MPEGPEITYLTEFLQKHFVNQKLLAINILRGRYKNHDKPYAFNKFIRQLPLKCLAVRKKGKVIFMYFENDWCLVSKLGMTGWWYDPTNKPSWRNMYPNIVLKIAGEDTSRNMHEIHYSDFRNFGTIALYQNKTDIENEVNKLAPDILSSSTTFRLMMQRIAGLSTAKQNQLIENAIVDQKLIVSGIGNYLKSEVLYDARISPIRTLQSISKTEWFGLFRSMKSISTAMLRILRKNDPEQYTNAMLVYGRKIDKEGNVVESRITKTGRTTYWVPTVQH